METAENVDMVISTLIDLEASPEILFQLLDANEKYCNLSRSQKRCIKSDINKFSNLLKESQRLYDLCMKKDEFSIAQPSLLVKTYAVDCCRICIGKAHPLVRRGWAFVLCFVCADDVRNQTSSRTTISAASPRRGPSL